MGIFQLLPQDQVRTQPFTWLWEEIQRRGLDGIGRTPKALMQLHQVLVWTEQAVRSQAESSKPSRDI